MPPVSPVKVHISVDDVHVVPPGDAVIVYEVIDEPPCDAGANQLTMAPPFAQVTAWTLLLDLSAT